MCLFFSAFQSPPSVPHTPPTNSCRKRTSRHTSSPAKECYTLSSDSDREDSSDSRDKYATKKKAYSLSPADYTCHLCNTAFQEHELLNEHMILHRNNSLIEAKAQGKPKQKSKNFNCETCNRRLSTWQSLQQHNMIHNNEKPHVCRYCKKDFRHLSNYKAHVQRHKEEERKQRSKEPPKREEKQTLDRSVVRGVDFGRLVGPLFMKETLLSQKNGNLANAKTPPRNQNEPTSPVVAGRPAKTERSGCIDDAVRTIADDDVIPLKSFNRIENIVMNAARFIVKLDNVDANVLKRKIMTPDISIERGLDKRRRVVSLSPLAKKRRLDEIENIVIDDTLPDDPVAPSAADGDDGGGVASKAPAGDTRPSHPETLTDNELLELLNDDKYPGEKLPSTAEETRHSADSENKDEVIFLKLPNLTKFRYGGPEAHVNRDEAVLFLTHLSP